MTKDINTHIELIDKSISWATKYNKKSFPYQELAKHRRQLKKIRTALSEKCSAAAYGESQVGKSYLMSSLLSSPEHPFVIKTGTQEYSFIDELNPSGGNNSKTESTGVITRFTIAQNTVLPDMVRVQNLSIVDVILLLVDSYYNDIKINQDSTTTYTQINQDLDVQISTLCSAPPQHYIAQDDIYDICQYIKKTIGSSATCINQSDFCTIVAPVIHKVSWENWVKVFGYLWNNNPYMNKLFSSIVQEYQKLDFQTEIFVPFEAVLREKGTLLKIDWLDMVCGMDVIENTGEVATTDIYDTTGNLIVSGFSKGYLSALIAEVTFYIPQELAQDKQFLKEMDLLDFPGARSREKYNEDMIGEVLPQILRRGKVAYLFNKYSNSLRIGSVLFCHHNDQKAEATIGDSINSWINENIGSSPENRAHMLRKTDGVAPLFMIATKFNIDLGITKNDTPEKVEKLSSHWKRFDTVLPEIIKPHKWFDEWVKPSDGFSAPYFRNLYPLRDFYWSSESKLFDGYSDKDPKSPEIREHIHPEYPNYMMDLRSSFLAQEFVQKHFENPEQTWEDVAMLNQDGSQAIIRNLNKISAVLDSARCEKYQQDLRDIKQNIYSKLEIYSEPEDGEQKNQNIKSTYSKIRRSLTLSFGSNPEVFAQILDCMMISSNDIRKIAYGIIVQKTEVPRDFSSVTFIQKQAGIDPIRYSQEENKQKLIDWSCGSLEELEEEYADKGFSVDDVLGGASENLTTVADIVVKRSMEFWEGHLNVQVDRLNGVVNSAERIVEMLVNLISKLGIRNIVTRKIADYTERFEQNQTALINSIADYTSLVLNNFISNVGLDYLGKQEFAEIQKKAAVCGLSDLDGGVEKNNCQGEIDLVDTLIALDIAAANFDNVHIETLNKLPFWGNFNMWQKLLLVGFLHTSDVSSGDPQANKELHQIIEENSKLYI